MRKVDRSEATLPDDIVGEDGRATEEFAKAMAHIQAWVDAATDPSKAPDKKSFEFKVYKAAAIKSALEKLFHGKCAYCETYYSVQAPVDVEHFRPKGRIDGEDDHPGYWWLGMEWENLLPSCIDCNRRRGQATPKNSVLLSELGVGAKTKKINTGKKDIFPIAGVRATYDLEHGEVDKAIMQNALEREEALLIDPTTDDPGELLDYYIDPDNLISLVLPKDTENLPLAGEIEDVIAASDQARTALRGAVSIQVYGLNRLGLVQERTRLLRHLEFLRQLIIDMESLAADLDALDVGSPDATSAKDAAARRIRELSERVIGEIGRLAADDAPYCSLVRAWRRKFIADLTPAGQD